MLYLPNRYKSPDVPEQPLNWNSKEEGYEWWHIVWVRLARNEEDSSLSYMHRMWWCTINESENNK